MSTEAPTADPIIPAQDADDMLAKMADEEVHRMLAGTEDGAMPAFEAPPPEPIAAIVEPLTEATAPATDQPPPSVEPMAEVAAPVEPPPPAESTDASAHRPPASEAAEAPPAETSHESRHAESADSNDEIPLWLKPLAWINAPLVNQSDAVRNFVGWAAVMTLANSVAVLAYVFLIRRHGH